MPLIKTSADLPDWCEMQFYEILTLSPGDTHICERAGKKEKIIVDSGNCQITWGDQTLQAERGTNIDLGSPAETFSISKITQPLPCCGLPEIGGILQVAPVYGQSKTVTTHRIRAIRSIISKRPVLIITIMIMMNTGYSSVDGVLLSPRARPMK